MKNAIARKVVRREDYAPYPWNLEDVDLRFEIGSRITTVRSELRLQRRPEAARDSAIVLDGQGLELVSVALDGRELGAAEYRLDADRLEIPGAPASCQLAIEVRIRPHENTALEGLYHSAGFLLTQCEAEGFRKITYFPDRPDVMARYAVTVVADRARYPVLLSNGNLQEAGELPEGRHWARWVDPFRKPCYLFALVAGDLAHVEDRFTTRSGREVRLRVYVEHRNLDRCGHALASLLKAMRWDEERYGLEYDLDVYNIVVTDDFNMGAMENKSLNIFNSKYVLAGPDVATDNDYQAIEAVIGHEYFHNWTGNRVTCRDWFQLTLKEGLTVFRDQEFSSDMQSRAVKRIRDVRELRSRQFPEDAGPMAHPIRPDHYIEINNFYTMTVYQKGATVVRMLQTLLGRDGFGKGLRLYLERHDGQAATCDDFLAAMADANGVDLSRFGRWYGQSGTPALSARDEYDPGQRRYTLRLAQSSLPTHDQQDKLPLVIPVAMGLLARDGSGIPLRLAGEQAAAGTTRLLVLSESEQSFVFEDVPAPPVVSLLRDFSAPVTLEQSHSSADLVVRIQHDPDAFIRWESAQLLAQGAIMGCRGRREQGQAMRPAPQLEQAFAGLLRDTATDPALLAEAMMLPGEDYLAEQMEVVDVDGLHAARRFVQRSLARQLGDLFRERRDALSDDGPYDLSAQAMGRRSLRNVCLHYMVELEDGPALALEQFQRAGNMTDRLAALAALVFSGAALAQTALAAFERQWRDDPLVMDKWFALQAMAPGPGTVATLAGLMAHPAFAMTNPNKVRSLIGAFAMSNPTGFHAADGAGYRFIADRVIELNALNPQVASRIVCAFNNWRRYDPARQQLMRAELGRISGQPDLSPDVAEIVGNALA